MVGAGAAVMAPHGLALASPAERAAAPRAQSDVVILTSGWPLNPLPTAEEIEADAALEGYAAGLQAWLDENPGVTFERIEANIWDPQAILTAVAGGTAPTYIYPQSLGNWSDAGARNAFIQGLMKDVAPAVEKYGLIAKLTEGARAGWEPIAKIGEDQYMSYPIDSGMTMVYIRRDLLEEAGVELPGDDWTVADMFAMARAMTKGNVKGLGGQTWMAGANLSAHGFDLLSTVPAPETGWNWLRAVPEGADWAGILTEYRKLVFEDNAVMSDVTFTGDDPYTNAFVNGAIAMYRTNILSAFSRITQENSLAAAAASAGKSYEEMFAFRGTPRGANGYFDNSLYVGGVAISPDATDAQMDKALSVVDYMFLGPGWDIQKAGQYAATQDLTAVFNYPLPIDGKYEYEGVPGTFADAWGQQTLDDITQAASRPKFPNLALYMPLEQNPGPDGTAFEDAWSTITYVADETDTAQVLQQAVDNWNAQAAGFSSSIPDEEFIAAAKAYFTDVDAFWADASPEFYESVFKPWYEGTVLPALG